MNVPVLIAFLWKSTSDLYRDGAANRQNVFHVLMTGYKMSVVDLDTGAFEINGQGSASSEWGSTMRRKGRTTEGMKGRHDGEEKGSSP